MWSQSHIEALEAAVEAHPGGNTGNFGAFLRARGIYLDRKTIAHMLYELPHSTSSGMVCTLGT